VPPADTEPWRIRGCNRLTPLGLAVLRELWHWREKEALAASKPPYFILAHEVLLEIANSAGSERALSEMFPRHLSSRRQAELVNAVDRGLSLSTEQHPEVVRFHPSRPSQAEKRRFEELRKKRDHVGLEMHIDPTLIASRAMLGLLAHNWNHHSTELMNWQRELLSDPQP
jgi:ribonuclease D